MSVPQERIAPHETQQAQEIIARITGAFEQRVVGQEILRESLLVGLLTGGHILLESVPGLAKTTAAQAMAHAVGGSFRRIQCTPDLLPSDIVGTQVYDAPAGAFRTQLGPVHANFVLFDEINRSSAKTQSGAFRTQLGPVHANFVLLDEINRSSAKTQSAMLEAMQERQTSIGGESYRLPEPFLVMATQNPIEQEGTYALPEAQLDRFMLKDVLDYPTPAQEAEILRRVDEGVFSQAAEPVASLEDIARLQSLVSRVYVDQAITEYIVGITYVTRHVQEYIAPELARLVEVGASPRASINLRLGARALAILHGRDHVIPEDIRRLAHRVLRHRIVLGFEADAEQIRPEQVIDAIFASVRTP